MMAQRTAESSGVWVPDTNHGALARERADRRRQAGNSSGPYAGPRHAPSPRAIVSRRKDEHRDAVVSPPSRRTRRFRHRVHQHACGQRLRRLAGHALRLGTSHGRRQRHEPRRHRSAEHRRRARLPQGRSPGLAPQCRSGRPHLSRLPLGRGDRLFHRGRRPAPRRGGRDAGHPRHTVHPSQTLDRRPYAGGGAPDASADAAVLRYRRVRRLHPDGDRRVPPDKPRAQRGL